MIYGSCVLITNAIRLSVIRHPFLLNPAINVHKIIFSLHPLSLPLWSHAQSYLIKSVTLMNLREPQFINPPLCFRVFLASHAMIYRKMITVDEKEKEIEKEGGERDRETRRCSRNKSRPRSGQIRRERTKGWIDDRSTDGRLTARWLIFELPASRETLRRANMCRDHVGRIISRIARLSRVASAVCDAVPSRGRLTSCLYLRGMRPRRCLPS